MQDSESDKCSCCQASTLQQATEPSAVDGRQALDPMPSCVRMPATVTNKVQTLNISRCMVCKILFASHFAVSPVCCVPAIALWDTIAMFLQALYQGLRLQSGQRQQVTVADKQIQTGGNLGRASKPWSHTQTGTLEPSLSMRSMRPILGETTLNMLEVSMRK